MTLPGARSSGVDEVVREAPTTRVGLYFGVLQLVFSLSWIVYVIFLPQLAARAGIGAAAVGWILLLDQAIFTVCDWAAGAAADRVAGVVGRLGRMVVAATALSTIAFLLLPWVAASGSAAFLVVVVLWSATSSALRAPPLKILGRYTPVGQQPWVSSLFLLGVGVASALGPFLGGTVAAVDPRIPFAVSAVSVMALSLAMVKAERLLTHEAPVTARAGHRLNRGRLAWFLFAVLLLSFAFQVHSAINAEPSFARFASGLDLDNLLSVFWVGFSLSLMPASLLTKRFGGLRVMAAGALLAAAAASSVALADGLIWLCVGQFVCGCAWAAVVMSAVAAALAIGCGGAEGKAVGLLFSAMAVAAAARIAVVSGHLVEVGSLPWLPVVVWVVAALMVLGSLCRLPVADAQPSKR